MKFTDFLEESPVGQVGRTSHGEALNHIENSDVEKEFFKVVKKLGGKTVAKVLLNKIKEPGNDAQIQQAIKDIE